MCNGHLFNKQNGPQLTRGIAENSGPRELWEEERWCFYPDGEAAGWAVQSKGS